MSNFLLLGPMFHTVPLSDRLSKDDAKFVDVIHCAGLWVGMDEKVYLASFNSRIGRIIMYKIVEICFLALY